MFRQPRIQPPRRQHLSRPTTVATSPSVTPTLVAPAGVCAGLLKNTVTIPDIVLNNANVLYISVSDEWWHLEPVDGQYNFSKYDALVAQVPARKKIRLGVAMSGLRHSLGDSMPDWVFDLGIAVISYLDTNPNHPTYNQIIEIPVPWDLVFLEKKAVAIAALGAHFEDNPKIAVFEAPVFTGANNDWSVASGTVVDGVPPLGSTITSRMIAAGYTHAAMLNAGAVMLGACVQAFPNSVISIPTGPIHHSLEPVAMSVATEVLAAARGVWGDDHIMPANYGLSNKMPFAVDALAGGDLAFLRDADQPTGGQALWNVSGDSNYRMNGGIPDDPIVIFEGFVDRSVTYTNYLEVYLADLVDPDMAPAIAYANSILVGT